MSTIASWAYKSQATFWKVLSSDVYGQPTYELAYTLFCAFELVEALGSEGSITSSEVSLGEDTFYFELATSEEAPQVGWAIAPGELTGDTPPASAKRIKRITRFDVAMFDEPIPDYKVGAS